VSRTLLKSLVPVKLGQSRKMVVGVGATKPLTEDAVLVGLVVPVVALVGEGAGQEVGDIV
jgi:hypothetical protein